MSAVLVGLACLALFVLFWEAVGRLAGTRGGGYAAVVYLSVLFVIAGAVWVVQSALSVL